MSAVGGLAFVAAGALGAVLRYLVDGAVAERTEGAFPWGTFVVNVGGSLLSGFVSGLALYHAFPTTPRLVLATGFCGAFTTFSTLTFETVRLLEEDAVTEAVLNLGLTAVAAGGRRRRRPGARLPLTGEDCRPPDLEWVHGGCR